MDIVGCSLNEARQRLESVNAPYTVSLSKPINKRFKVDETQLYVVRQHLNADGSHSLLVVAKMGKEVF